MLAIRMQRAGHKGYATFRIVIQDSRRTPTSGKVVEYLGSYDPHSKVTNVNKDKLAFYLEHGARPSGRMVNLLKTQGVKLPKWVDDKPKKTSTIRYPEKLRKNRPATPGASEITSQAETTTTETETPEPKVEAEVVEAPTPTEPTDEVAVPVDEKETK